jgi:hypothetical protein
VLVVVVRWCRRGALVVAVVRCWCAVGGVLVVAVVRALFAAVARGCC